MKKAVLVLSVVLFVLAGIVITGCPTDPDEGKKVDSPDLVLAGGKLQYTFATPTITDGIEYEVILAITEIDEELATGHFGGQLYYDDTDDKQYLLAGWQNGDPNTIVATARTYRWTFKAGQKYDDGNAPISPATTPTTAKRQYFQLVAQDSNWSEFEASKSFGIKGTITVQIKKPVELVKSADITTTGGGAGDTTTGKGNIEGDSFTKVNSAPTGSVLRFSITGPVGAAGSGSYEPGYGVGCVGNKSSADENAPINIPAGTTAGTVSFTVDVLVSDALACRDNATDSWLFVNIWDFKITKCELWVPKS